ncbi:MAG: rRNA maturation RNase YbeY [Candidatus Pacebacteria bacterium]|nr:rRNA maturation RNase YbeY [Candidatus Paceibacterota bacterium]
MADISIKNFTRRPTASRAVFSNIATDVLPDWDISLAFVGAVKARALNKQLRNKDYIPNVLSYRTDAALPKRNGRGTAVPDEALAKSGEIIICLSEAAKQAPAHALNERTFVLFLFIHGLLHIKGWAHGARMEACERKLVAKYGASNSHRH